MLLFLYKKSVSIRDMWKRLLHQNVAPDMSKVLIDFQQKLDKSLIFLSFENLRSEVTCARVTGASR